MKRFGYIFAWLMLLGTTILFAEAKTTDLIVVHGMKLYGKLIDLGPQKLSFKLDYAEGVNHIKYSDIDRIRTEYRYHISFNRNDIVGRIVGIEEGKYLVVEDSENHKRVVAIEDIDNFVISTTEDNSFENRIRNAFPYHRGTFALGMEVAQGNSKKRKIDLTVNARYKKAQHEMVLYADYAYETTETEGTPQVRNKDELTSFLSYRNHYTNEDFWFASFGAEFDIPRHINRQFVPSLGYGHRFKFEKNKWIETTIGVGYAYVDYSDVYRDKRFTAAAFGMFGAYQFDDAWLVDTLIVNGFMLYYPSIEEGWSEDWIFRSNLDFTVPLFEFLSVKLVFDLINDSNPNPEVGNNKTSTKLLFGIDF